MSEQKQIEKWYNLVNHITKDLYNHVDTYTMIRYIYLYYIQCLSDLLSKDFASLEYENLDEKINCFITLSSAKTCKIMAEELAHKFIHNNVNSINKILIKTQLSEDSVLSSNNDTIQSFYDTEIMLENLTYKNDPNRLFRKFLQNHNIHLAPYKSIKQKVEFTFHDKTFNMNKSIKCCTIHEFLSFCATLLLDTITEELLSDIEFSTDVIKTTPHELFDFNFAIKLKNCELYQYLDSFDYIRINFFLGDLYLLLYYDEINDFKNYTFADQL